MTSALQAPSSSPFLALAALATKPLSSAAIAKVVKDNPVPGVTEESLKQELREILETNTLGDKTPTVTQELAAQLKALAPPAYLHAANNLAYAIYYKSIANPNAEAPFARAATISAAVMGVRTAMQGQLAEATPEQKSDKAQLLEILKGVQTDGQLSVMAGAWAAFARAKTDDGHFEFRHDALPVFIDAVINGKFTEELKQVAQGATAISPEEAAAIQERALKRPIAGKTDAELQALYDTLAHDAKIGREVYRPEMFRTKAYQDLLDAINESPEVAGLRPLIVDLIAADNKASETEQNASLTVIGPDPRLQELTKDDPQMQAAYKIGCRIAEKLAAGNPSIARIASSVMNAWVSGIDLDHPHITFYSALVNMCWDGVNNDWIKWAVDKDNKPVPMDSKDAVRVISGEKIVETVFAHELTHVLEQAVMNSFLLQLLVGASPAALNAKTDKSALAGVKCECPACNMFNADAGANEAYATLVANPRILKKLDKEITADPKILAARLEALVGKQNFEADGSNSALEKFILRYIREGESTADFGSVLLAGEEAPIFMAMAFDVPLREAIGGEVAAKRNALMQSWSRNHAHIAKEKLAYVEKDGAALDALNSDSTHPSSITRALANTRFAQSDVAQLVYGFESETPRYRLLSAAQALDAAIERAKQDEAAFQTPTEEHKQPDNERLTLHTTRTEIDIDALQARMRPISKAIAELIFADGLASSETEPHYADLALDFIDEGGNPLFKPRENHDKSALLARILGGGKKEEVPTCIEMSKQIGEELATLVAGSKLDDETKATWAAVIDAFVSHAATKEPMADQARARIAEERSIFGSFGTARARAWSLQAQRSRLQ